MEGTSTIKLFVKMYLHLKMQSANAICNYVKNVILPTRIEVQLNANTTGIVCHPSQTNIECLSQFYILLMSFIKSIKKTLGFLAHCCTV